MRCTVCRSASDKSFLARDTTTDTKEKVGFLRNLRRDLIAGLVVIGPVIITVYLLVQTFKILDSILARFVNPAVSKLLSIELENGQQIPGLGLVALLLLLIVTGSLARRAAGRWLITRGQQVLNRIPLINRIYKAVDQISKAVFSGRSGVFQQAVLVEYPSRGIYSLGIVTADTSGKIQAALPHDCLSVFILTTPNPTTGFLLFIPKKDIIFLDMPVEEALKQIISAGAISALEESPQKS